MSGAGGRLSKGVTHVKTPGSDSVSCQPLESSSPDISFAELYFMYMDRKIANTAGVLDGGRLEGNLDARRRWI
jgi:hypothetical protein